MAEAEGHEQNAVNIHRKEMIENISCQGSFLEEGEVELDIQLMVIPWIHVGGGLAPHPYFIKLIYFTTNDWARDCGSHPPRCPPVVSASIWVETSHVIPGWYVWPTGSKEMVTCHIWD